MIGVLLVPWSRRICASSPAGCWSQLAGQTGQCQLQAADPDPTAVIDTVKHSLSVYWVYGLDRRGPDWTWEAEEDIYDVPIRQ